MTLSRDEVIKLKDLLEWVIETGDAEAADRELYERICNEVKL